MAALPVFQVDLSWFQRRSAHVASLTGGKEATDLDILAAAFAESGRWAEAMTTAEQAIRLAAEANQSGLSGQIAARLLLYGQQQPYRVRLAK